MAEQRTFLFQINVTRDCNLRCTHCYISTDKKVESQFMSEDQYIAVFEQIRDFLAKDASLDKKYNLADIHVIGGEPTMLGVEFFSNTMPRVREIVNEIRAFGPEVKLGIVSNLVTKDAVSIATMFDQIATSYEVDTRFVSTGGRPLKALEKSWINNVKDLQSVGHSVSATMAVTKQAVAKGSTAILDEFYKNGFRQIHLGFFIPSGDGLTNIKDVFPRFEETSDFMIEATEWYLSRRLEDKDLYVNPIESMIESVYSGKPMDDIVCPIIPGSLDIDWNGETVTCIEAGGEVDMTSLGNVFKSSISEVLDSREYRVERSKAIMPKPHCIGCDELRNCQSACGVLHDFWNGKGECPGFKKFIKHIRQVVDDGAVPKSILLASPNENEFRAC